MPRLRTPDNTARKYLFGGNCAKLARETGIPARTISRYKEEPRSMSFRNFCLIAVASGATDEELVKLIKEWG